jgi:hypothetical protein
MEESLEETLLDYLITNKFEEVEISLGCAKEFVPSELLVSHEQNEGILIKSTWGNNFEFVDKETDKVLLTTDDQDWLNVVLGITPVTSYID